MDFVSVITALGGRDVFVISLAVLDFSTLTAVEEVDVRAVPIPVLVTQAGLALAVKCLTVLVTLTVTTMVSATPQVIRHTADAIMVGLDMLVISLVSKDSKIHRAVTDVFVTQGGLVSTVMWSVPSMER